MNNFKTYVVYHSPCTDGFMSAYIANLYFKSEKAFGNEDVEYISCAPNKMPHFDEPENAIIYFFDVAPKREDLIELRKKAYMVKVIDHHITNKEELGDLKYCHFEMDKCGATLAWEYFFQDKEKPWWVLYNQERDLGTIFKEPEKCLPDSLAVNAHLTSIPFTFQMYDDELYTDEDWTFADIVQRGKGILAGQQTNFDWIIKSSFKADFVYEGKNGEVIRHYDIPVVNSSCLQSKLGNELSKNAEFACVFAVRIMDGIPKAYVSLRSQNNGAAVDKIAKCFKGGGHQQAAAFSLPLDTWFKIIRNYSKMEGYSE